MAIEKILVLSTGNMPSPEGGTIEPGRYRWCAHEHGWIVFFSTDVNPDDEPDEGWIAPIIKAAREAGCAYIDFDSAAPISDCFPVFDW